MFVNILILFFFFCKSDTSTTSTASTNTQTTTATATPHSATRTASSTSLLLSVNPSAARQQTLCIFCFSFYILYRSVRVFVFQLWMTFSLNIGVALIPMLFSIIYLMQCKRKSWVLCRVAFVFTLARPQPVCLALVWWQPWCLQTHSDDKAFLWSCYSG